MKLLLEKLGVVKVDEILKHCLLVCFEDHPVMKVPLPENRHIFMIKSIQISVIFLVYSFILKTQKFST